MISERRQQKNETMDRLLKILNDRVFADSHLKSDGSGYWAESTNYRICLTSDGYDFMYRQYSICEIEESDIDFDTIESVILEKYIHLCNSIEDGLANSIKNIKLMQNRLKSL